jgi:Tol biopolymer transport system component
MEAQFASRDAVLEYLEKVLGSETFAPAGRSRMLLKYLVEQAINGQSDHLKEYTIGVEAMGRGESFDPRTDSIVRAEASRLRSRLEHYYATEGAADTVRVVLQKGSYVPGFEARASHEGATPRAEAGDRRRTSLTGQRITWFTLGASTLGAILALSAWVLVRSPAPSPRVVTLTALPGLSMWPTFSPDGRYVAFTWSGEKPGNLDIYIKMVGSSEVQRLTSDPAPDFLPAWSPDGLQIAFVRGRNAIESRGTIYLVSPLGGPERKLSEFPAFYGPFGALSWSPDGRFLAAMRDGAPEDATPVAFSIYRLPIDGGEPRAMTRPVPAGRDLAPAFSTDGKQLAYASCETRGFSRCHVNVVALGPDLVTRGAPHRVTGQGLFTLHRIAWAPDGRSLLYDTQAGPETYYTWRVSASGTSPPERLEIAGVGAWLPAASDNRLAFTRSLTNTDIVRFAPDGPNEVFAGSSYWDSAASFSPDGQRVAFESMRSGDRQEIWVAAADGRDPVQLTRGPGRLQASPAWSPDGRRIAFQSQGAGGKWDVWTIELDGSAPRRLTISPEDETEPRWSHDGRLIHYGARREGKIGIARVPAEGGVEQWVVTIGNGTFLPVAQESADGTLYYSTGPASPLFVRPRAGGPDRQVVECVSGIKGFVVAERGVYYADCGPQPSRPGPPQSRLHRLDLSSGSDRILGALERYRGSLTVSPDEKTILYSSVTRSGSDLMIIEGFR